MSTKFDWKELIKVLFAVVIMGAGWTVDNQAVLITAAAVGIVWLLGLIGRRFNWQPGKAALTTFLFILAVGLQLVFTPVVAPLFPAWTGEISSYLPLLIAYTGAWIAIAGPVVSAATLVYNILLAKVLEGATVRLLPRIGARALPGAVRGY